VLPFAVAFQPGTSLSKQVAYAAKKAIVSGQMKPGDPFPSVRTLSNTLKINVNTAHKIVTQLTTEGLLEVQPGIGMVVAARSPSSPAERGRLLKKELEQLVVEAKKVGLELDDVTAAIAYHWAQLS
jgi:GntR family transcriptional regulator